MNSKALVIENLKFRQNQLKQLSPDYGKDNKLNVVEKALLAIENGLNIDELKQSPESLIRMHNDIKQFEQNNAVKEYRFITQQIEDASPSQETVSNADLQKMIEENKFLKIKI